MTARKLPPGDRPLKTLERLISKSGIGSRSEARSWIAAGHVTVNDKLIRDPDHWVDLERDRVTFDGKPISSAKRIYLLLHKPVGYLTTYKDPEGRPTVYDLLPERGQYVFPVGRLDLDTSGLLSLTNDAQFAERMTNPEFHVPKTYAVKASKPLSEEQLDQLRNGLELRDGPTRPAKVTRTSPRAFEITITEGRNRQVRRMVEALDANVEKLTRIAIGALTIGEMAVGTVRELTDKELRELERVVPSPPRRGREGAAGG